MAEVTHFADYSPHNLGTDFPTAACGETIHVRDYSLHPTCKKCQPAARVQRALLHKDRLARLRREQER